ncbi:MAG: hypothetical protein LQ340_001357, partial [Diploschistes diacapsis]
MGQDDDSNKDGEKPGQSGSQKQKKQIGAELAALIECSTTSEEAHSAAVEAVTVALLKRLAVLLAFGIDSLVAVNLRNWISRGGQGEDSNFRYHEREECEGYGG